MPNCAGVSESRNRSEWDPEDGGYCAADGSAQHAHYPEVKAEPAPHPDAVSSLAAKHLKPKLPAKPPSTDDNDSRTRARTPGPDFSAGVTSSGDSVYASAALLKGRREYVDLEILSASAQVGAQTEFQVAVARGAASPGRLRGGAELLTARTAVGIHNPDGSTGFNATVGAHFGSVKLEYEDGATSVSVSRSAGVGASVSVGTKEVGEETAFCASAPVGLATVGACIPMSKPDEYPVPNDGAEGASGKSRKDEGSGGVRGW